MFRMVASGNRGIGRIQAVIQANHVFVCQIVMLNFEQAFYGFCVRLAAIAGSLVSLPQSLNLCILRREGGAELIKLYPHWVGHLDAVFLRSFLYFKDLFFRHVFSFMSFGFRPSAARTQNIMVCS